MPIVVLGGIGGHAPLWRRHQDQPPHRAVHQIQVIRVIDRAPAEKTVEGKGFHKGLLGIYLGSKNDIHITHDQGKNKIGILSISLIIGGGPPPPRA